jgi:hypothetical protein
LAKHVCAPKGLGNIFLQPQVAITLSYRQPESPSK